MKLRTFLAWALALVTMVYPVAFLATGCAGNSYISANKGPKIDVKSFGALGDGTTDDTTAVQAAVAYAVARANTSPTVFFPAGTYRVHGLSHASGVRYEGDGSGQSVIEHMDGYAEPLIQVTGGTSGSPMPASAYHGYYALTLQGGNQTTALVYYDGQIDNQVKFNDVQFTGGSAADTDAISVRDYINMHLERIRWDHIGGWGINVRDGQHFSHASLSVDSFTYDNQDGTAGSGTWGKGLLYLDTTNLTVEKGVARFSNGRIEINDVLTTAKPANGVFRIVQSHSRLDAAPPQVVLDLDSVTVDVVSAARDMKVISADYRDVALAARNFFVYGINDVYNNDTSDAKNAIVSAGVTSNNRIHLTIPNDTRFNQPTGFRQNRFFGMNVSSYDSDSNRDTGLFSQGDFAFNLLPFNTSGRVGRVFAVKAVQQNSGRHTVVASSLGTGGITSGTNTLTMSAALSNTMVPGQSIDVAGAGSAGGTLTARVTAVDYATNVVTLSANASTTVAGAAVSTSVAQLAVVDMVFYGTAAPSTGTYQKGDKVLNTDPDATEAIGWICTASGSPGTWAAMQYVDLVNTQTIAGAKTWTGNQNIVKSDTQLYFGNAAKQGVLYAFGSGSSMAHGMDFVSSTTTARATAASRVTCVSDGSVRFYTDTGLTDGTGFTSTERARISAAGNLLVGTTTDAGGTNKLQVNGNTTTTSIAVGGGTAITKVVVYSQSLDVASVAANSTDEQTFTVTGLTTADKVIVNKPSHTSGLIIANVRVSAPDTLAITFGNITAAPIDPAAETYPVVAVRN